MERNDARLDAEAQEEQHKRDGLLAAGQLRCGAAETREVGASADLDQQCEAEEQASGIDMRHDNVEQSSPPGFLVFVIKGDQPVGDQGHHFPADQE
jgi:hypothetical protein